MKFCAEIMYDFDDRGVFQKNGIHSDICWNCNPNKPDMPLTDKYREFLHQCLDEWLDKSNGSGHFGLGHWGECECEKCS